jgi:glycosyltransferase involved in cell wall biosynthesis
MKILVINNAVPFLRGGAEKLADTLVDQLRRCGHEADLLRVPFRFQPAERIYDEILACRLLRLYNVDRVIGLKFPAYLIPHPHKTMWLVHQYRQAYDLAGTDMSNIPNNESGENLRHFVVAADNECFAQTAGMFAISQVVKQRLHRFNGFDCQVLPPPLDDADMFHPDTSEDYIFCGGRVNRAKRQHLLVEAMRHIRSRVRLLIAGPADAPEDAQRLRDLVVRYRLQERVQLEFAYHPRERLARWVNRSLACACVPFDEDYGYVTLEAFYAGKPVLSTTDAGGILDFVTDRETGRVTPPEPVELAAAIDELADDPRQTAAWGKAAREHILARNINWPETVRQLVA